MGWAMHPKFQPGASGYTLISPSTNSIYLVAILSILAGLFVQLQYLKLVSSMVSPGGIWIYSGCLPVEAYV